MGKATRWFKGLFGIKTAKENVGEDYTGYRRPNARHDAVGLCNNPATIPPNITPAEAAWLSSFFNDSDKDRSSKHAIAVAAATAAAADAAVAAAQAAVAVVRLTSQHQQGRGGGSYINTNTNASSFAGGREKYLSALKIQSVFRGFLARKALRALKGLVKIQALVRGFLVRKQAAATLHSMQALIRAQASVRAQRNRSFNITDNNVHLNFSTEIKNEDTRSTSEHQHISSHSRRLSSSLEPGPVSTPQFDQEIPKIVEIDTGSKVQISKSRRSNSWITNPDSIDITESLTAIPHRINTSCHNNPSRLLNPDNSYWDEHCHVSTTQSTPRFATDNCGCEHYGLITPSKSACLDGYNDKSLLHPNYMAKTVSFKAKLRSHSAPRQRPEGGFSKRRLSLHDVMESRNSLRMERSSSSQSQVTFKNAVMGKINGRI